MANVISSLVVCVHKPKLVPLHCKKDNGGSGYSRTLTLRIDFKVLF